MTTQRGPQRVGEALDRLLGSLRAPRIDVVRAVFEHWDEIVGSDVARHTRPVSIDGERLTVAADDPAWAGEVRWLGDALLERVAEVAGTTRITKVTVKVARRE